jgi:lipopolysaccharide transport protein LptA
LIELKTPNFQVHCEKNTVFQTVVKRYFILALSISVCIAAEPQKKDSANDIKINADNMQYDTSHQHADANGNVILTYLVKGSMVTLKAENLHAEFDDQGNLTTAKAEGKVEIDYAETKLLATQCVHDFNANHAVCTGDDVTLIQEKNEVHGTEATLDIATHVFTMQASQEDQVTCIVYPKKKE